MSPDVNTSKTWCLKSVSITLLREAMRYILDLQPRNIKILESDMSPDVNTFKTWCLKLVSITSLREAMRYILDLQPRNIEMIESDMSPNVNSSETLCLKPVSITSLREEIIYIFKFHMTWPYHSLDYEWCSLMIHYLVQLPTVIYPGEIYD